MAAIGLRQQGIELAPRDRPCRLDRVLRHVPVAADDVADPGHVVVMSAHDPGQGVRVSGCGLRHGRRGDTSGDGQFIHHALWMSREREVSHASP